MRRFVALLKGLPWDADMRAPDRAAKASTPREQLRRVSPLEAFQMVRGGVHASEAR